MHLTRYFFVALLIIFFHVIGLAQDDSKTNSLITQLLVSKGNEKAKLLILISDEYLTSKPDLAFKYANEALSIARETENRKIELLSLLNIAEYYQIKTKLDTAINISAKAKEIAVSIKSKGEIGRANLNLGNCFRQLGEYKRSSSYCFEALQLYEEIENEQGICNALNSIGIIYFEQKEFDRALDYFTKALKIAITRNNTNDIGRGYNNVAVVFSNKNDKNQSIDYLKKAININRISGHKQWLCINYNNIAEDYLDTNEPDSAYKYVMIGIGVNQELENYYSLADSYNFLGNYYIKLGDTSNYINYLMKSIALSKKHNLRKAIVESSGSLKDYYYGTAMYDSAYHYQDLLYRTKDSLDKENSLTRLTQLEILYELEKQEQEKQIKEQRNKFITYILIILLVFTIILMILLLLRFRIKTRYTLLEKTKLQDELDFKNKEMTTNVMALMKKNEMLLDITRKLIKVESEAVKDDTKSAIKKIAIEIENSTRDNIWNEFEIRFKQVHTEFYDKLIHQFPHLTPNEQRLCAFLRLNMSSKDISELTGQSTSAIEKSRFRLRKKLGISGQDINLISFISRI